MKHYTIYHIPGEKIGCSSEPENRVQDQGFTDYEVLEVHTDIYIASDREIELQKQYGYKVDKVPYWQSVENRHAWTDEDRLKAKISLESNGWQNTIRASHAAAKNRKRLTYEIAQQIRQEGWVSKKNQYQDGPSLKDIAEKYNTTTTVVKGILQNKTYTSPDWYK